MTRKITLTELVNTQLPFTPSTFGSDIFITDDGDDLTIFSNSTVEDNSSPCLFSLTRENDAWETLISDRYNDALDLKFTISSDGQTVFLISGWSVDIFTNQSGYWTYSATIFMTTMSSSSAILDTASSGDGNTLVVISKCSRTNLTLSIYVNNGSNNTWYLKEAIQINDARDIDKEVSLSLDYDGKTIVVGRPNMTDNASRNLGQVEVFKLTGNGWSNTYTLFSPLPCSEDCFGQVVKLSDDGVTLFVASAGIRNDNLSFGVVTVFSTYESGYSFNQVISASDDSIDLDVQFGTVIELSRSGEKLLVSATADNKHLTSSNKVYEFNLDNHKQWKENRIYETGYVGCQFGEGLSMNHDGSIIVIGGSNVCNDAPGSIFEYREVGDGV